MLQGLSDRAACHCSSQGVKRRGLPQHLLPSYLCYTGSCFVSAHWKFHYWNFRANYLSFSVLSCGSPSLPVVSSHWEYRALQTKTVFMGWTLDFSALQGTRFTWLSKMKVSGQHPHLPIHSWAVRYMNPQCSWRTCTRPACMCIYKWYFLLNYSPY